jgi:catechol 2,3-dioxygenase-like lactoylglutathione lyase family enzyme
MAVNGLLHLNLNVSDIERSKHFYLEVFGLIFIADTSGEIERNDCKVLIKQIVLGWPSSPDLFALSEVAGEPVGPHGMSHFGFVMPDEEVLLILERLEHAGGSIIQSGKRSHDGVEEEFAYVRDLDGYAIELSPQRILYSMDTRALNSLNS